jgi:hypothetical protein
VSEEGGDKEGCDGTVGDFVSGGKIEFIRINMVVLIFKNNFFYFPVILLLSLSGTI